MINKCVCVCVSCALSCVCYVCTRVDVCLDFFFFFFSEIHKYHYNMHTRGAVIMNEFCVVNLSSTQIFNGSPNVPQNLQVISLENVRFAVIYDQEIPLQYL